MSSGWMIWMAKATAAKARNYDKSKCSIRKRCKMLGINERPWARKKDSGLEVKVECKTWLRFCKIHISSMSPLFLRWLSILQTLPSFQGALGNMKSWKAGEKLIKNIPIHSDSHSVPRDTDVPRLETLVNWFHWSPKHDMRMLGIKIVLEGTQKTRALQMKPSNAS